MITSVKGTRDILPGEIPLWHFIEDTCAHLFHLYGFEEIRLPIFEVTELFARGIGDTTDIVEKEMYTFEDRNGLSITLRPEGTASVVRAYIQHHLYNEAGIDKVYYLGPMFRYEKPQKGRYRQFYQIGAEILGSDHPAVEAETIDMLRQLLERLGIADSQLHINSIGCPACRPSFHEALRQQLERERNHLCADCQRRIDTNPLRVLDCKNPGCQPIIEKLPRITDYLCDDCTRHHAAFKSYLGLFGIPYHENPRMVRGLDYYVRTTFEITSGELGAQNSLLGGGRYDGLVEQLGGPPTHGFGFALGLDRFVLALPDEVRQRLQRHPDIYLAPLGSGAFPAAMGLAARLRRQNINALVDFQERSLKSHLRFANRINASFVAIMGEEEIARNEVSLKNLGSGEQIPVPMTELPKLLSAKLDIKE